MELSVLDLSVVRYGGTSSEALADTTELAQAADRLGFVRFWVAEHHNMATVASTTPGVLIAHLAARTERIRVGSGGVMLPNHAPLAIAEQFALLESLHPGRIDLGIGRAPGTDPMTASAFGRPPHQSVEQFPRDLIEVMGMLGDPRREDGMFTRFRATPVLTSSPTVALLGSSGFSAQLSGMLGLPFAYAHHFDTGATDIATQLYRDHFEPSPVLDEPYLIVGVGALAAPTTRPSGSGYRAGSCDSGSAPTSATHSCRRPTPSTTPTPRPLATCRPINSWGAPNASPKVCERWRHARRPTNSCSPPPRTTTETAFAASS
ncbi:MAG: LLM class flavin-dependent oxidoreductase [Ilumatobacter sp.]